MEDFDANSFIKEATEQVSDREQILKIVRLIYLHVGKNHSGIDIRANKEQNEIYNRAITNVLSYFNCISKKLEEDKKSCCCCHCKCK